MGFGKFGFVGAVMAVAPGETGYTAVDLEPGRYLAACFVPTGMTPAAVEENPDFEGGEPHFMQGMFTEFTVA